MQYVPPKISLNSLISSSRCIGPIKAIASRSSAIMALCWAVTRPVDDGPDQFIVGVESIPVIGIDTD